MRPFSGVLAAVLLVQVCALAQTLSPGGLEPVPSAAQPAVQGRGDQGYARRGLEALRAFLNAYDDEEELPGEVTLPEVGLVGRCSQAEGAYDSMPVLLCQYGPSIERPVAHAIFWQDGRWEGQLYPQAPDRIASERRQLFRPQGCAGGCQGVIRQGRLGQGESGPELLVVVDQGSPAAPMEEVQLLHLMGDSWQITWLPAPGDWNWGHARVKLLQPGLTGFEVRSSSWGRQDRFAGYLTEEPEGAHRWFGERWVRKGDGYLMRDQVEEPGAYGSLVRLVYYLSHYDERRARDLLDGGTELEEARKALAQQPPRQGWRVERVSPAIFRLDRDGDGKMDLTVGFTEQDGNWVLNQLGRP